MTDDVYDLIERHWPYDGPLSRESVTDAAAAVALLVRYINNATGPGNARTTLEWAVTVDRVLGSTNSAVHGLDQLLRQLADAMRDQAADPSLYDDRRDRPAATTALAAGDRLNAARRAVSSLAREIERGRALTNHLGNE